MKYTLITGLILYFLIAASVFALHMQMPVTLGLAVLRSVFWPMWICGGFKGFPLPMD